MFSITNQYPYTQRNFSVEHFKMYRSFTNTREAFSNQRQGCWYIDRGNTRIRGSNFELLHLIYIHLMNEKGRHDSTYCHYVPLTAIDPPVFKCREANESQKYC